MDDGIAEPGLTEFWEKLSEDFSFVFYSCDLKGRIRYLNRAGYDVLEHHAAPEFLNGCSLNSNLFSALRRVGESQLLTPAEIVRRGDVSHFEEIVPCHGPNQNRWTLLRLQRFGEELVFNYYFLRHYTETPPENLKIRCIVDSGSWEKKWALDRSPVDDDTARALCPNCALHFYSWLRQHADNTLASI